MVRRELMDEAKPSVSTLTVTKRRKSWMQVVEIGLVGSALETGGRSSSNQQEPVGSDI